MTMPTFTHLNFGWNAEPNAPDIQLKQEGTTLVASVRPNPYVFPEYGDVSRIAVSFFDCSKYRVTSVNDHGWYLGQCRFSKLAPSWGEFYEISGDTFDDLDATPWTPMEGAGSHHFHFYLRDEALEVKARDWSMRAET
ncbi:MAG: hypothetical protein AB7U46_16970 [Paenirhodobacter sp.]